MDFLNYKKEFFKKSNFQKLPKYSQKGGEGLKKKKGGF